MSSKYPSLLFALLSCLTTLKAQQPVVVPLNLQSGNGPFQPSAMIGAYLPNPGPEFKLNGRIALGAVWRFNFDPEQIAFSEYVNDGRKDSNFVTRLRTRHWDTTRLSSVALPNFLYVYSGMDGRGNFLIIPDRNHNLDFNDDTAFVYKCGRFSRPEADSIVKTLPYETFHIPVWEPDAVHDVALFLRFVPGYLVSLRMSNPLADTAKIAIELFGYAFGHTRIEGKDLKFYVATNGQTDFRSASRDIYRIFASGEPDSVFRKPVLRYFTNKVGDSIPIAKSLYTLDSVDMIKNNLILGYAGVNHGLGILPGTVARNFTAENILTDRPVSLSAFSGKYVLLDFWGTWCIPCKETVPGLKDFHTKYPDLQMVGIALDDKLEPVIEYLKNEEIGWPNIFENRRTTGPKISDIYNVQNYPTFILIDRKGKIIFREYGLPGFTDLEKMVPQLLSPR
jgi:thiol-disulfide isomerase/thioredoxin